MCTRELYNMGTSTKEEAGLVLGGKGWFSLVSGEEGLVSAGFRGGRTCFGWFQGGNDWLRLVSGWEGLVSGWEGLVSGWEGLVSGGFVWEGLVLGGFGSFRFLVTTHTIKQN